MCCSCAVNAPEVMAALAAAQVKDKAERVNVLLAPVTVIDIVQELLNAPLPAAAILAVAGKITVDLGGELLGQLVLALDGGLDLLLPGGHVLDAVFLFQFLQARRRGGESDP